MAIQGQQGGLKWNRKLYGYALAESILASLVILLSIIVLSIASNNSDRIGPSTAGIMGVMCGCLGVITGGVGLVAFRSNVIKKTQVVSAFALVNVSILIDFILFAITAASMSHISAVLRQIPSGIHDHYERRKFEVGITADTLRLMLALESILLVIAFAHMLCCIISSCSAYEKWNVAAPTQASATGGCKFVAKPTGKKTIEEPPPAIPTPSGRI